MTRAMLAVSLHDVEPASFERCALIRDWLDDLGVHRVTLLVIPAPQLARSSDLTDWLLDRVDAGDAVALHERTRNPKGTVPFRFPQARSLRLDLHPADFEHPRHALAVERLLRPHRGRLGGFVRLPQG